VTRTEISPEGGADDEFDKPAVMLGTTAAVIPAADNFRKDLLVCSINTSFSWKD
jgi:hypothetical protein